MAPGDGVTEGGRSPTEVSPSPGGAFSPGGRTCLAVGAVGRSI
jgi:hypothetical protein